VMVMIFFEMMWMCVGQVVEANTLVEIYSQFDPLAFHICI